MLDTFLSFLREQGILIVMGLLIAGGILTQMLSSIRYRKLRQGIRSLAALQAPAKRDMPSRSSRDNRSGQGQKNTRKVQRIQTEEEPEEVSKDTYARQPSRSEGQAMTRREALAEAVREDRAERAEAEKLSRQETEKFSRQEADKLSQTTGRTEVKAGPVRNEDASKAEEPAAGSEESLVYVKQSLDHIAAGREEVREEENESRPHRKLSAAEEKLIRDILKEYLA